MTIKRDGSIGDAGGHYSIDTPGGRGEAIADLMHRHNTDHPECANSGACILANLIIKALADMLDDGAQHRTDFTVDYNTAFARFIVDSADLRLNTWALIGDAAKVAKALHTGRTEYGDEMPTGK